jgi:methylated-DNA-protein-cysteine methyltransferase-like protein
MRFFEQVYALVCCIPPGRVATYGQIARLLGQPHAARTVGWAMRDIPEGRDVPWHRVVNASGRVSIRDADAALAQRRRLETEGVAFDADGRINLDRFGWVGLPPPAVQELLRQREDEL